MDWHPTKGLLVSGSKDHQVKLWDPRTGRCLTTLHGHKNTISKTIFEPTQGHLLATSARDHTARIFDLRMMRDVLLLRGHEKDIITMVWHPIHKNLLSTGGVDGSLFHYLLDEQNPPAGTAPTLSPYDTPDPSNAPAQTIYPAHKIQYAHDFTIWTLDWHPLGHILASGSNDRVTRFWTRARPGDINCFNDRYHIGQAAAEAQGTYDRRDGRKQRLEEEELEAEEEADGLVDQKMPTQMPTMPGLPGISDGTSVGGAQLPGIGGAPPPPPPSTAADLLSGHTGPLNLAKLQQMFGGQLPPPPLPGTVPGQFPPPPPAFAHFGAVGGAPPVTALPPGFQLPPGFPAPPIGGSLPVMSFDQQNGSDSSVKRRAPLPSQKESLREEMKRGNYRTAR